MKARKKQKQEETEEEREERREKKAINEEWKLLKAYEGFIYEVVFELGVMDRMYDIRTFLELASDKYAKIKEDREKRNTRSNTELRQNTIISVESKTKTENNFLPKQESKSIQRKNSLSPSKKPVRSNSILKISKPPTAPSSHKKVTLVLPETK